MAEWRENDEQHVAALALMDELHREGFTRLWLESMMVFSGGRVREGIVAGTSPEVRHHHLIVILDEGEIDPSRFALVMAVAARMDASIRLMRVNMNQSEFSRIALWPGLVKS